MPPERNVVAGTLQPMLALTLVTLALLLQLASAWKTWDTIGENKDEGRIHERMTKREATSLFGNHDGYVPDYKLASVELQFSRHRRVADFVAKPYHLVAVVRVRTEVIRIQLIRQIHLVSPSFEMEIHHENGTELIPSHQIPMPDCLFHGDVTTADGTGGKAALNTCGGRGLTGVIIIGERHFVVKPLPEWLLAKRPLPPADDHVVYTRNDTNWHGIDGSEAMIPPPAELDENAGTESSSDPRHEVDDGNIDDNQVDDTKPRRWRRAEPDKVVETAVYIDDVMYELVKKEVGKDKVNNALKDIVYAMINAVQLHYNQPSLGYVFRVVLVKLNVFTTQSKGPNRANGEIKQYLTNFCKFQEEQNPADDATNPKHWDHALLLSGTDLYQGTKDQNKVIGLAWVEGMCRSKYSCSINEGNNFESVFVISHEMGHNLGMHHDGTKNDCASDKWIMSPTLGPGKITWSTCSKKYIADFLKKVGTCMDDKATPTFYNHEKGTFPGERYALEEQCDKAFGKEYTPYRTDTKPFENICRELWCRLKTQAKRAHPALDGSECASGKVCWWGECISKSSAGPDYKPG